MNESEYVKHLLAAELKYLEMAWAKDATPPSPKDHRTERSIATIDALKRQVDVQARS